MKNFLIFTLVFLFLGVQSDTQWKTYYTSTNASFSDIKLVDQNIIWACGSNGIVVKTVNAGSSWINSSGNLPVARYWHITAVDQNNAWVTSGSNGSKLYRTTNGGVNWVEQFYNQPYWINKIHFFNQNTGIFLRDPLNPNGGNDTAGFFITRNGGLNWYRSSNTPRTTVLYDNCMDVIDTNFICIIDNDKIYMLKNGLENVWQAVQVSPSIILWNASFININTGYVSCSSGGFKIFKTTNSGLNWDLFASHDNWATIDFDYIPNTNFAFATSQQEVRVSTNSGLNWCYVAHYLPADSVYLSQIDAIDTNSVWLAADRGYIFKYDVNYMGPVIGVNQLSSEIPDRFTLHQNYPNPFNPVTKIKFDIPKPGNISFRVCDVLGKIVYSINEYKDAGSYEIIFNGNDIASGIYYYSIEADGSKDVKKMVLLK